MCLKSRCKILDFNSLLPNVYIYNVYNKIKLYLICNIVITSICMCVKGCDSENYTVYYSNLQ